MDWNLIPEIFYDMIARIIPGSVLVLATTMVYLGPSKVVKTLLSDSTEVDTRQTLAFFLLAYLVAVVMGPVWNVASGLAKRQRERAERQREKKKGEKEEAAVSTPKETKQAEDVSFDIERTLFRVRKDLPKEASRLIKIQAERSLCEVLIAGFSLLWPVDLWLCIFGPPPYRGERVFLLVAMALSIFSCWKWRAYLQEQYIGSLLMLQSILDEQEREKANTDTKAKKWWQIWK